MNRRRHRPDGVLRQQLVVPHHHPPRPRHPRHAEGAGHLHRPPQPPGGQAGRHRSRPRPPGEQRRAAHRARARDAGRTHRRLRPERRAVPIPVSVERAGVPGDVRAGERPDGSVPASPGLPGERDNRAAGTLALPSSTSAIYWMDVDGRRELLASDPNLPCNQPVPLRPAPGRRCAPASVDYRQTPPARFTCRTFTPARAWRACRAGRSGSSAWWRSISARPASAATRSGPGGAPSPARPSPSATARGMKIVLGDAKVTRTARPLHASPPAARSGSSARVRRADDAQLEHAAAGRNRLVRRLPRAQERRPAARAYGFGLAMQAGRRRWSRSTARRADSASRRRSSRSSTGTASAATRTGRPSGR